MNMEWKLRKQPTIKYTRILLNKNLIIKKIKQL